MARPMLPPRLNSPDEPLYCRRLPPKERAELEAALRTVAAVQEGLPRRVAF
jgi:hypothetical protein